MRTQALWYRARSARDTGRAIRDIRKAHGLTQQDLADQSTISRSTVQRMERSGDVALAAAIAALGELGYEMVLVPRGSSVEVTPK